jgi:sugar O-acyltransferase (sialic acid O-acetyltransferase NeuD family)
MPEKPLVLVVAGPSTQPRIVLDILAMRGRDVLGYIQTGDRSWGLEGAPPCLGGETLLDDPAFVAAHELVVATGDASARRIADRIRVAGGGDAPLMIHPAATVSPSATIGEGPVISAGVVVQMNAVVGRFCQLNTACTVDHDNVLEDGVNLGPGAHLAGHVTIRAGAFVGLGATVINRVVVGRGAQVGAGAVVIRDVPDGATVVGNPAQVLEKKKPAG